MCTLCSPRRTSLRSGSSCWTIRCLHAGGITPHKVSVPAQNTHMGLKKSSFFQVLEITIPKSPGKPLKYWVMCNWLREETEWEAAKPYDWTSPPSPLFWSPNRCLKMAASMTLRCLTSQRKLHSQFPEGVCHVASIYLQIGYPTVASVPCSISSGYKCVLPLWKLITNTHLLKR